MKDRLTTAPLPLDRPQCSCGTLNARSAIGTASWPLEQPQGFWNAQALLERPPASWNAHRGLVKNHYYTRATHGIVEAMWSNRGAFVERDFAIVVLKCRMRVQIYYFFLTWQWVGSDCVRYWSGLRACAPMIGQSKKKK